MPSFRYIALTAAGERVAGIVAAATEQAVLAELESRRLTPVQVDEQQSGAGKGALGGLGARGKDLLAKISKGASKTDAAAAPIAAGRGGGAISMRRLAMAYVQLGDLLRAGVPLMRGLRLLGGRKAHPRLGKLFGEIADAVAQGSDLAEAMAAHPEAFPKVHIALVRAGEKGGFLEAVLTRLGLFLIAQADLRGKVIGNLIYPALLVVFGIIVLGLVFGVFIPKFKPIFVKLEEAGRLPLVTKGVLGAGDLISKYGLWTGAVLIVLAIVVWRISKLPNVQRRIAVWWVKAPVVGPIVRGLAVARFCRILGTMLGNAIPLLAAMQIAKDAAGNTLMEEAITKATESVRQGQPLSPPLSDSGLFPEDVIEMIAVGESANNLDDVLVTIADTVEQRLDRMLSVAVKLIEPMMLLILAGVIGTVAIALILPMSQIAQTIK